MFEPCISLLSRAGFDFSLTGAERKLSLKCENFPLEIFFVRATDVPSLVKSGAFDLGITGFDLLCEKGTGGVEEAADLGFARCTLALAAPAKLGISSVEDLQGMRIATSFPRIASEFFSSRGVRVEIVELNGAVENACRLGAADAIVDLVASGATLEANGLAVVETLLDSSARLVKKSGAIPSGAECEFVAALKSVVEGKSRKFLVANAPESALDAIRGVLPALCAPTVSRLLEPGMISVQAVVNERELSSLLPKLGQCGASGIVVSSVERLVL
jgi:ATP phosphoribosyltransferase